MYYANGDSYEGHWHRNLKHGQGKYQYVVDGECWQDCESVVTGTIFEGQWELGQKIGDGVARYHNGTRFDGTWSSQGKVTWTGGSCCCYPVVRWGYSSIWMVPSWRCLETRPKCSIMGTMQSEQMSLVPSADELYWCSLASSACRISCAQAIMIICDCLINDNR